MSNGLERWDQFANNLRSQAPTMVNKLLDGATEEFKEQLELYTPVDTGLLRSSWTYKGAGLIRVFTNNIKYGVYVNYGHRQEIGRYVPKIHARLVRDYVPGTYFVESAVGNANLTGGKGIAEITSIWNSL